MRLNKINFHSVQTKLNIVLIALITIILTGFGVYDYISMKKKMVSELNEIADGVSDRLSGSMVISIWDMHKASGIASVKSEMNEKRVYSIVVKEINKPEAFVAFKRDEETWEPIEFNGEIEGSFIKRSREIIKDEEKLGSVEVFLTPKFMQKDLISSLFSVIIKIFILDLIIVAGMSLIIKRVVTKPFKRILERVRDIVDGKGDLTMRVNYSSQDEIGSLAELLNRFIENLQNMVQNIFGNAETLNNSSSVLSNLSKQMSEGADNMSFKSRSVSKSSEEVSSTMNGIAASMEEAATNLQMVAGSIEEMSATVNEIASNSEKARGITENAVSQAGNASNKVNDLGRAAMEIEKVTATITEISEQTNLLALNATIEAARAGEAGKGFAVVANEIKELAKQTADATQEIKNRIQDIQTTTKGTVNEMEQISGVIYDVNEIVSTIATAVEEQSVTTMEIAENVTQASQGVNEVNENVAQTSSVCEEIAKDMGNVNQLADEMSNSGSQVNLNVNDLNRMVEGLREMVSKFKV